MLVSLASMEYGQGSNGPQLEVRISLICFVLHMPLYSAFPYGSLK